MKSIVESIRAATPALFAFACVVAIHPTAQAETRQDTKKLVGSVRVPYADLDLAHPADTQILVGRIEEAAFRACGGDPRLHMNYNMMPGRVAKVFEECREDAIARAMATVASST